MTEKTSSAGVDRRNYAILTVLFLLGLTVYGALVGLSPDVKATPAKEKPFRLMLGGDVFVGDRLLPGLYKKGVSHYTNEISEITRQADLHLATLEAPITTRKKTSVRKRFLLRSHPAGAPRVLSGLNIDGVSLANNHVLDYEPQGLLDTMKHLTRSGIRYVGAGANRSWASRPTYFKRQGRTVGFLGFSNTFPRSFWATDEKPGSAYGAPATIRKRVRETDENSDITVVSFHWGSELDTRPKEYQKRFARMAVEEGADVVFGHHPHSIQPYERYKGGVIFYSLGNYFFTTLSHDVDYGLLADLTFTDNSPDKIQFHVLNINNYQVKYKPDVLLSFQDGNQLARFFNRPNFMKVALLSELENDS